MIRATVSGVLPGARCIPVRPESGCCHLTFCPRLGNSFTRLNAMRSRPALSLRSKFILIVLGGAVLPLALLGFWLNGTAERSGEALLRERLETSLGEVAEDVGLSWLTVRGESSGSPSFPRCRPVSGAAGAQSEAVPPGSASSSEKAFRAGPPSSALQVLFADLQGSVEEVRILDAGGEVRWRAPAESAAANAIGPICARPLPIQLGIFDLGSGGDWAPSTSISA